MQYGRAQQSTAAPCEGLQGPCEGQKRVPVGVGQHLLGRVEKVFLAKRLLQQ